MLVRKLKRVREMSSQQEQKGQSQNSIASIEISVAAIAMM